MRKREAYTLLTIIMCGQHQRDNITLEYDAANMKITNLPAADEMFHYEYRKGWSL